MVVLPRGLGIFVVEIIDEILCAAQNVVGFSQIQLWELRKCPTQTVCLVVRVCASTTVLGNALKCSAAFKNNRM